MAARYTLKPHILHTMVYRNGELIAILPNNYWQGWAELTAQMSDDIPPF